jgi:hypothetical protein
MGEKQRIRLKPGNFYTIGKKHYYVQCGIFSIIENDHMWVVEVYDSKNKGSIGTILQDKEYLAKEISRTVFRGS